MGGKYFVTDRVRGRAIAKITAEAAMKVGQADWSRLSARRPSLLHRPCLSSYMIEYALVAGFTSVGAA